MEKKIGEHVLVENANIDSFKQFDLAKAKTASDKEKSLPVWKAVAAYKKAIFWSFVMSLCIIMEGYDCVLIGAFYAQNAFTKRYGQYYEGAGYEISAQKQLIFGNVTTVGNILGAVLNGFVIDRFGFRWTILVCLILASGCIFITFFAKSFYMIVVGGVLFAVPLGGISVLCPQYAAEVCPTVLRGYLTIYVDLCWIIGQLISAGVQDGFKNVDSEWAYRIPFAIQWCWIPPLFITLWFCPESPWWLARHGKVEEAEHSLRRLCNKDGVDPSEMISEILHTQLVEEEIEAGSSLIDCFRGVDIRRTEIVCGIYVAQNLCGLAIGGQPTYFLEQAGISSNLSFNFTVGVLALGFVCVLICAWLMTYIGRRKLLVWGLGLLSAILYVVGFIAVGSSSKAAELVEASLIFVWAVIFYLTLGPVVYAVVNEVPSMRLRAKTVSLARNAYYVAGIVINILNPYMVNNSAWGWKGKTCLFYGSTCLVCFIWAYFRLPESKGRTYEELDVLFSRKLPARKFESEVVDLYSDVEEEEVV